MEYKYVPVLIIGLLIFMTMFSFLMDFLYSPKDYDEYVVYQVSKSYESESPEDTDDNDDIILLAEENSFYTDELL